MGTYIDRMESVKTNDKIVYYDYIKYKEAAGWHTSIIADDWYRPTIVKKSKYHSGFLQSLPNYYFLGFPIKELLKSSYSNHYCHSCAVALALCFDDFEIVTCNLKAYADYLKKNFSDYDDNTEFEHTFIVINIDVKKIVIDTTWGMITDYDTYDYIFHLNKIRRISSSELKNTEIYEFIESRKLIAGPSHESYLKDSEDYLKYRADLQVYMDMCQNYSNDKNKHLQDFFNRCLYRTSNSTCLWDWRGTLYYKHIIDTQIEYPSIDMISIEDDEYDFLLDSSKEETKQRNATILENYHKQEQNIDVSQVELQPKQKIRLLKRLFTLKNKKH